MTVSALLVCTLLAEPAFATNWAIRRDGSVLSGREDVLNEERYRRIQDIKRKFPEAGEQVLLSEAESAGLQPDAPATPDSVVLQAEASPSPSPSPSPTLAPTAEPTQTPKPTLVPTPKPTRTPVPKPKNKTLSLKPLKPRPTPKPKPKNITNVTASPSPSPDQPLPPPAEVEEKTVKFTLNATVEAGSKSIPIKDAKLLGFKIGRMILINPGGETEENHTITGFASILIAKPLEFKHFPGETVRMIKLKKGGLKPSPSPAARKSTKEKLAEQEEAAKKDKDSVQEKEREEQEKAEEEEKKIAEEEAKEGGGSSRGTSTLIIIVGAIIFAALGSIAANLMAGKRGVKAMPLM